MRTVAYTVGLVNCALFFFAAYKLKGAAGWLYLAVAVAGSVLLILHIAGIVY